MKRQYKEVSKTGKRYEATTQVDQIVEGLLSKRKLHVGLQQWNLKTTDNKEFKKQHQNKGSKNNNDNRLLIEIMESKREWNIYKLTKEN